MRVVLSLSSFIEGLWDVDNDTATRFRPISSAKISVNSHLRLMLPTSPGPERSTLYSPLPVILKDRFGDKRGYFKAKVIEDEHLNKDVWYHLGYPQDRDGGTQPYHQCGITVARLNKFSGCPNERRAMFVTDADAIGGPSGGPFRLGLE